MYLLLLLLINEDGIYWHLSVMLSARTLLAISLYKPESKGFNTYSILIENSDFEMGFKPRWKLPKSKNLFKLV